MHDVGKVGIPDGILLKPGRVTAAEFSVIKQHVALGHSILSRSDQPLLKLAAEVAETHHERWDGGGYLHGMRGEEIPLAGRITAIADTFDALVSRRVYKDPIPLEPALYGDPGGPRKAVRPPAGRRVPRLSRGSRGDRGQASRPLSAPLRTLASHYATLRGSRQRQGDGRGGRLNGPTEPPRPRSRGRLGWDLPPASASLLGVPRARRAVQPAVPGRPSAGR